MNYYNDSIQQKLSAAALEVMEGKKPVSQMTPAEKEADAKKRKEYKAYQKSKRNEELEEAAVKVIPEKLPRMNRDEKDIADTLTKAGLVYGKVNKFDSGKFIDPKTGVSITIMRNGNAVAASSADGGTLLSPTDPSNLQAFLKKRGLKEVEEPRAQGEKDFKAKHVVKVSGDKEDGTNIKETNKEEKYKKFFDSALKKFGVKSPAELEGAKKKEFFDYVDANYEADNEED